MHARKSQCVMQCTLDGGCEGVLETREERETRVRHRSSLQHAVVSLLRVGKEMQRRSEARVLCGTWLRGATDISKVCR